MKANPTVITWTNPTERTDGTPYGAADNAGYELAVTQGTALPDVPWVSLPLPWGTTYNLNDITEYKTLRTGVYSLYMRVVDVQGVVSDWTAGVPFQVVAKPRPPMALAIG